MCIFEPLFHCLYHSFETSILFLRKSPKTRRFPEKTDVRKVALTIGFRSNPLGTEPMKLFLNIHNTDHEITDTNE